ncbi:MULTISPECIES: NUDIX hydrolase [Bombella]|uniref:NrtR DNA-binding winged helix domain-containing protein n=2 Tax=Bombella TaxID=1654741 RepID=A0ABT3WMX1_9PROT|nr:MULTISPECIES: hypothetical protein [Bombella]MCX5615130.1 hypothetical protein [Bombella saccharophila]MCX5620258.1 hypothetical protein [Bombella pollinis]MUG90527.1 hypothetical protein [Bombella sp. ESL0385]
MTYQTLCPTDLITVLMTLGHEAPHVALLRHDQNTPTFEESHHSLQQSLCHWAETLTHCPIGYMEQLYTFSSFPMQGAIPHIHITYLALSPSHPHACHGSLYQHFPWEDRRSETGNAQLAQFITAIEQWATHHPDRQSRIAPAFGLYDLPWDDTRVLERYELLWESGLVPRTLPTAHTTPHGDDRRLLATALSRLRARIRYSPAVFELLPKAFTLLQLQQAIETLSGRFMHKPNFRRLVLHQNLVEETGAYERFTAGRPAKLYQFRPAAMASCYLGSAFLPIEAAH